MDLGQLESKQNQAQFKLPFELKSKSNDQIAFGGLLKTKVQNQLSPKIMKLLLIIHKYSVVHVGMVVVIIELPNISKQIKQ